MAIDPGENRKATKAAKTERAANSFKVICREWLEARKDSAEPDQHKKTLSRMENDVFPWLGGKAITEKVVYAAKRRLEKAKEEGKEQYPCSGRAVREGFEINRDVLKDSE
jgi:hypothetical protein